jgi:hypothetical protein
VSLRPIARWWFGVNAAVVLVGMIVQLVVTSNGTEGFYKDNPARILNTFCYFTVQSNLIVGVTCLMLAAGWANQSTVFRTFRLIGLVGITLTFLVFHAVLKQLQDLTGQAAFADFLLHTASPLLCIIGWLWFGPRRQTTRNVAWFTLIFLVAWGTFTLIRGSIVGFYPYPFMNPNDLGYLRVAINLTIVAAVFVGLAFGAHVLDGWLDRRQSKSAVAPA